MNICPWCDKIVDETKGDDKVIHNNHFYHYECFCEKKSIDSFNDCDELCEECSLNCDKRIAR